MNIGRHLLTERCTITLIQKFVCKEKPQEEKACRYHIHCLMDCYSLQENWDKMQVG